MKILLVVSINFWKCKIRFPKKKLKSFAYLIVLISVSMIKKVEDDEIRNMFILNAVDLPVFKDPKFFA